jgi:hypothetical protein
MIIAWRRGELLVDRTKMSLLLDKTEISKLASALLFVYD